MYRSLIRWVSQVHRRARAAASRKPDRSWPAVERLEDRRLLATGTIHHNLATGSVSIVGTVGADRAEVWYLDTGLIRVQIRTGDDVHTVSLPSAQVAAVSFRGGNGDDEFFNRTDVAAQAWGEAGHDRLVSGTGNDLLGGNIGADTLDGGGGDDRLEGHEHADVLLGGVGDDDLLGGPGDDVLEGEDGQDLLRGEGGADSMLGGAGADLLRGGNGTDQLWGGAEDDRLYGGPDADSIAGGDGDDLIHGEGGDDSAWGEAGADTLLGSLGDDLLAGGADDDQLEGGEHADQIQGGEGDDTLRGGDARDALEGDEGADWLLGDDGADVLRGGPGPDVLRGGDGDDQLSGGLQADQLYGELGDDILEADAGDDWAFGGDGLDLVFGGDGNDLLDGGAGHDQLHGGEGADRIDGGAGRDTVAGNAGDDSLAGDADADLVLGDDGADTLRGGSGNDELRGDAGDDLVRGDGDHDTASGGDGADVILGDGGDDALTGSEGRDVLVGGLGMDHAMGGGDEDILIGGVVDGFDADDWQAIRSEWSSSLEYDERIDRLKDPDAIPHLKSNSTVHDDLVRDTLDGNADRDWYVVPVGHDDEAHDHAHTCEHLDTLDQIPDLEAQEQIESNMPHPTNQSLRTEHCAIFALVPTEDATHVAVASGDYLAAGTWQDGQIPGTGSRVWIPAGITVTVSGLVDEPPKTIRVGGTLAFDPRANTELHVDTVVVDPSGVLRMGTAARPVSPNRTARILITNDGPLDRRWDPVGLSRSLLVHGAASFFGAEKTPWLAVESIDSASQPGRSILQLESVPAGWRVSDELVIAGTRGDVDQHETRQILAIRGSEVVVQALEHDHAPLTGGLRIHVGNLTRNVEVRSQTPGASRGGHVMFMHTRDVDVSYAAFVGLGRSDKKQVVNDPIVDSTGQLVPGTGTNSRGRYALHFHRNGVQNDGLPAEVTGAVVVDSPGWGYVSHASFVNFRDSISFNVDGAGFVTENGSEIGEMTNNLAVFGAGSGEGIVDRRAQHDFGHQGDGFWLHGPGMRVVGNVASGQHGNGFVFFTQGLIEGAFGTAMFAAENIPDPTLAAGRSEVPVGEIPLREFRQNIAYANAFGLTLRYHLQDVVHDAASTVEDLTLWNNTRGVWLPYSAQTVLRNVQVLGSEDAPIGVGVDINALTEEITFDRVTVVGYSIGLRTPQRGVNVIRDSYFNNMTNIEIATATEHDRRVTISGATQFGTLADAVRGPHEQIQVAMKADFSPVQDAVDHVFSRDRVLLDFGPYKSRRVFYFEQRADFIPFPEDDGLVDPRYIGLTNRQLWDRFGLAIGGQLAPSSAREVPGITGLLN